MKKILLSCLFLCASFLSLFALKSVEQEFINETVSFDALIHELPNLFGNQKTEFKLNKTWTDEIGMQHANFKQYLNGNPIESAMIVAHGRNNIVSYINGYAMMGFEEPKLASRRISKARSQSIAGWKLQVPEKDIKKIETVVIEIQTEEGFIYKMVDKVEIFSEEKTIHKYLFVDVVSGEVIKETSLIAQVTEFRGNTYYYGWQPLLVDSMYRTSTGRILDSKPSGESTKVYVLHDNEHNVSTYNYKNYESTRRAEEFAVEGHDFALYTPSEISIDNVETSWLNQYGSNVCLVVRLYNKYGSAYYNKLYPTNNTQPFTYDLSSVNVDLTDVASFRVFLKKKDTSLPDEEGVVDLPTQAIDTILCNGQANTVSAHFSFHLVSTSKAMPATDVHWGMGKCIEFYDNVFNHKSYDNIGSPIKQYVDIPSSLYPNVGFPNNACAVPNGTRSYMMYGLGDGKMMNPLVSIDIMAHEFTHLVTGSTANGGLDYEGESGALNESFSDVFGTTIEHYILGEGANWVMGEGVMINNTNLRSMENPKNYNGGYSHQPDTYKGQLWKSTDYPSQSNDWGGVHANNSIQNYWYYLLSQGGSGVNDKGYRYNVTGIGIEKARQIAYRNLWHYLTSHAQYLDARKGSLRAAEDLFGKDSQAYLSCKDAWKAVGVMSDVSDAVEQVLGKDIEAWRENTTCYVEAPKGEMITLYSITGTLLTQEISKGNRIRFENIEDAVVIVKCKTTCFKLIK